ncbi:GPI anchored CFEM domain protein [Aspergillus nomiae NRRL 13137]|uniref:GPI anchored CFEM domain protein n=1 Tax=Aspergillus nomiae NRRL (strain ATCC 15546 / NRRL 13137 / CBS 260.88 / M93) TaxID=1509407 RepID=A0A0L1IRB9_ASPN3|nr:GPI anchored CFEM domain protein [Aspergillus nomiae NRRL 13137]KNG82019.1 GPI anchored CFEM domain protein [Aspergillus nomiae NRRL 13137]
MQLVHHLIVLFASLAVAQNLPNIPPCAVSCLITALQGDGCPSITDFACHCQKPELVPKVTPCVAQACPLAEQSCTPFTNPYEVQELTEELFFKSCL